MSPEVIQSKLGTLLEVLSDLKPHVLATTEEQVKQHYEIERQVQLCVDLCLGIARRLLSINGHVVPPNGRETIQQLAKHKYIEKELADQLCLAVGMRNVLVHEYVKIDYERFFGGLLGGYKALKKFADAVNRHLSK